MTSPALHHRELSILVGILAGLPLSIFATSTPVPDFGLIDIVIFASIPVLSGALAGFSDPENSVKGGAVVGIIAGLAYVIMASLRLPALVPANTVLFLLLTVPIWAFLAGAGAMFAHRTLLTNRHSLPSAKICGSCKASNPDDALFCKNCGTKLG